MQEETSELFLRRVSYRPQQIRDYHLCHANFMLADL